MKSLYFHTHGYTHVKTEVKTQLPSQALIALVGWNSGRNGNHASATVWLDVGPRYTYIRRAHLSVTIQVRCCFLLWLKCFAVSPVHFVRWCLGFIWNVTPLPFLSGIKFICKFWRETRQIEAKPRATLSENPTQLFLLTLSLCIGWSSQCTRKAKFLRNLYQYIVEEDDLLKFRQDLESTACAQFEPN